MRKRSFVGPEDRPLRIAVVILTVCFAAALAFVVSCRGEPPLIAAGQQPETGDLGIAGLETYAASLAPYDNENTIVYGFRVSVRSASAGRLTLENTYAVVRIDSLEPVGVVRGSGAIYPGAERALGWSLRWFTLGDNNIYETWFGPQVVIGAEYTVRVELICAPGVPEALTGQGAVIDNAESLFCPGSVEESFLSAFKG